ncbi:Outer membrane protein beta-barrel domain-containing protein [Spirosoma fluviale]|uniref:Outer membrane protein beta-barrel domain-containing protein n=1 Tax=Spirosoma fluviale TaxID=1597977 RepID=A0A286F6E4_9BACT|nr:Outer membrane protein beta-barrel domain-containing protein [Spirosoma fluviale]
MLAGSVTESLAQRRPNPRFAPYSSVTFGVGTSTYFGDLAGYRQPFRTLTTLPRWNVGLGYTRQFTPHFAARAMFTWARITGDDYTFNKNNIEKNLVQYARNLHFRNDLKEFAVTGIYNFIEDGRNSNSRARITPYIFGGLALVAHSPEARTPAAPDNGEYEARKWVKLQPLHTEGQGQPGRDKPYSLVTLAIPVGIGVRYKLNDNFNIGAEIGFRYAFTDYIDDVGSGSYADRATQQGVATIMSDRRGEQNPARYKNPTNRYEVLQNMYDAGPEEMRVAIADALNRPTRSDDGKLNDGYLLTNFSIHYIIPGKIKCPPTK